MLNNLPVSRKMVVALALLIGVSMGLVDNQTAESKTTLISAMSPPLSMSVEKSVNGSDFLQDMTDACKQLKCYTFDYSTTVFKGGKTIDQRGKFYFKQPRLLRVEMTGNYKHGAVAVLEADGKVRGHLGGVLGALTVTVSPDSDMLQGANGYPLVESDFAGMAAAMNKFVTDGCKIQVTEQPVSVEGQPNKVYVIEFYRGPNSTELYKRAYIDPKTLLPVEWFDYQNGKLFARTIWQNLNLQAVISDSMFKI